MREFLDKIPTKEVDFLGEKIKIRQMTIETADKMRALSNSNDNDDDDNNVEIIAQVIKDCVVGAEDMTIDEIKKFPMATMSDLFKTISDYSSVSSEASKTKLKKK